MKIMGILIFALICLMAVGAVTAIGLFIWLIADIVKEKRKEEEDGKS